MVGQGAQEGEVVWLIAGVENVAFLKDDQRPEVFGRQVLLLVQKAAYVGSDILRRLKPAASNVEVQRLQLPRRASWPVVSLLRPGVTPGTPEEHVPLAARLRAALRSA